MILWNNYSIMGLQERCQSMYYLTTWKTLRLFRCPHQRMTALFICSEKASVPFRTIVPWHSVSTRLSFFLCIWRHSFCNGWTSYVSAGRPARSTSSDFRCPHDRNFKRPLPLFPYVYFRSCPLAVSHTAPITSCLSGREFFYVYAVPYDGAFTESAERHF